MDPWTLALCLLLAFGALGWWSWWRAARRASVLREMLNEQHGVLLRHQAASEAAAYARLGLLEPPVESDADRKALDEIDRFADLLEQRLRSGDYLQGPQGPGRLNLPLIHEDLLAYLRAIGRHYRPHADDPLLALRPIEIGHVIHRTSLLLLGVVEQSPLGLHEMTLRDLIDWFERAKRVLKQYGDIKGIIEKYKLRQLWRAYQVAGVALAPTPAGVAMLAGAETARILLARYGPDLLFAAMVRRRLELVARTLGYEAMRTLGSGVQFRTREWLLGCELAALFHAATAGPALTRAILTEIGKLRFPTAYERLAVVGYLTDTFGLERWLERNAGAISALPAEEIDACVAVCERLLREAHDPASPALRAYLADFGRRWGRAPRVPGVEQAAGWRDCCASWAAFARFVLGRSSEAEIAALLPRLAAAAGQALSASPAALAATAMRAQPPFQPLVLDVEDAVCKRYLIGLVEALALSMPRTMALDEAAADLERFYRGKAGVLKLLHERWERLFASLCDAGGVFDDVGAAHRRALLAVLDGHERLAGVYRATEPEDGDTPAHWALALTTTRLLLVAPAAQAGAEPRYGEVPTAACTLVKQSGVLTQELRIAFAEPGLRTRKIVVAGSAVRSLESRYGPLLRELRRRGAADHTGWGIA